MVAATDHHRLLGLVAGDRGADPDAVLENRQPEDPAGIAARHVRADR
jgi:hypothetical protein